MHRLHEGDVGEHRLFMRGLDISHQPDGTDPVLDRVEQRQSGEDADGERLLFRLQRRPGRDVVRQRHLFRQPEIRGQAVPDLEILVVFDAVPVDGADGTLRADRFGLQLDVHGGPQFEKRANRLATHLPLEGGGRREAAGGGDRHPLDPRQGMRHVTPPRTCGPPPLKGRVKDHSAQDTQPCTSVPVSAIWRRRM